MTFQPPWPPPTLPPGYGPGYGPPPPYEPPPPVGLEYGRPGGVRPQHFGKPGSVFVVGALSVIVGLLALAGNWMYLDPVRRLHRKAVEAATPPPPMPAHVPLAAQGPPAGVVPHYGDYIGPRGLKAADRAVVIAAVNERARLSADRRAVLDRFLADWGRDLFPAPAGRAGAPPVPLTPEGVSAALAFDARDGDDVRGRRAAQTFRTAAGGTVQLDDTSAVYTGPGLPPGTLCRLDYNSFWDPQAGPRWCAVAIDEAIERNHARLGADLTPIQAGALVDAIRRLPPNRTAWDVPRVQIDRVVGASGTLHGTITPNLGTVWVLRNGRIVQITDDPSNYDPETGEPFPAAGATAGPYQPPPPPVGLAGAQLLLADVYVGIGMALALMICGGILFTDAAWGAELHRVWAVAKLCVLALSITATLVVADNLAQSGAPGTGPADIRTATGLGCFGLVIQAAYPFVVLATLGRPIVREYFAGLGAHPWLISPRFARSVLNALGKRKGRRALWAAAGAGVVLALAHAVLAGTTGPWHLLGSAVAIATAVVLATVATRRAPADAPPAGDTSPDSSRPAATGAAIAVLLLVAAAAALAWPRMTLAASDDDGRSSGGQGLFGPPSKLPPPEPPDPKAVALVDEARAAAGKDREAALKRLGDIGTHGFAALCDLINDPDPKLRMDAARALRPFGGRWHGTHPEAAYLRPAAAAEMKLVATALADGPEAAAEARKILEAIGGPQEATTFFYSHVNDRTDRKRRHLAARMLADYDPPETGVVEAFADMVDDPDPAAREAAVAWLLRKGSFAGQDRLTALLSHADAGVRRSAAQALAGMGPAPLALGPRTVGRLAEMLAKDPDAGARRQAAATLAAFGPGGLPALAGAAHGDDEAAAGLAREALRSIPIRTDPAAAAVWLDRKAMPAVLPLLDDRDAAVRLAAARLLASAADRQDMLADRLAPLLDDPDADVVAAAAVVLKRLNWQPTGLVSSRVVGAVREDRDSATGQVRWVFDPEKAKGDAPAKAVAWPAPSPADVPRAPAVGATAGGTGGGVRWSQVRPWLATVATIATATLAAAAGLLLAFVRVAGRRPTPGPAATTPWGPPAA